ncbi:MAG: bifunctional folylpolyglutamate synthase/dihydrofolate synthase [Ruminococcaceae bacterium]|nr:bifunctional folylpolyglutamate synthase/dihydrofolate synthase [Oscillospiraceae bacterium]
MNYIEAVKYIHSLLKFGIRPGLNGMDALLHFLDNPHKALKYVHVAGTNGKGSTSTAISNVLTVAGYKVGLYTSPYVTDFLERVQFNGKPVDKALFAKCVEKVKFAVEELEKKEIVITEFEALTASAFLCYKELECDIVVLEVGLGGRLDATNIIDTPIVNIITSLSIDHSAILGNTIEEIAFEKCGTIKENGNVICSFGQPEEALRVIEKTIKEKNNTLTIPCESDVKIIKSDIFGTGFTYKNEAYFVKMAGEHQVKNMTCVIEACNILKESFNITDENIKKGISNTNLPARIEIISKKPLVILDGGHNEDGAKAFYNAVLPELEKKHRVIVIAGMMADKAVEESLKPLMLKTDVFFAVTPDNPRAMKAHNLAKIASKYSKQVLTVGNINEAVKISYAAADENTAVLVVGSLYLAGEIRETLLEIF